MWVAVGVFAVVVGGAPDVAVQAAPEPFSTKAECEARQDGVRERVQSPPEGVTLVGFGVECVEVKVAPVKAAPKTREFTPQEKNGGAPGKPTA